MSVPGSSNALMLSAADEAVYSVERSLRFNNDDTPYLSLTPSSSGNRTTWTWSAWVKVSSPTVDVSDPRPLFQARYSGLSGSSNYQKILIDVDGHIDIHFRSSGVDRGRLVTTASFLDYSAWYHIVYTYDTTQSTANDRQRLYINGTEITSFSTRTNPIQNFSSMINEASREHYLSDNSSSRSFDGYMAEVHFVDGSALAASDFGEYDSNNAWQPKAYSGTHGTYGWYLDFSDATSTTTIGEDSSGNSIDWTSSGISVTAGSGNDSVFDSPKDGTQTDSGAGGEVSGNYCTLDYYNSSNTGYHSQGNLSFDNSASSWQGALGTFPISSGKWYWEVTVDRANSGVSPAQYLRLGIHKQDMGSDTSLSDSMDTHEAMYISLSGTFNGASYGTGYDTGDIIGVAFDADSGSLTFYRNGVSQGVATSSLSSSDYPYLPAIKSYAGAATFNFGQKAFTHSAPSGYKCLCTANLADPAVLDGSTAFDVKTYSGTGADQTINGFNFSPDIVIIAARNDSQKSPVVDSVRGATKELLWDSDEEPESTVSAGLKAFNSDGFDIGTDGNYNNSARTYVAWAWNAGTGSASSNTAGSETTSVKANTTAGLSVMSYAGTNATDTFGHGLNSIPQAYILKNRESVTDRPFTLFTTAFDGSLDNRVFNELGTKGDASETSPTSSVIELDQADNYNLTDAHIGYMMAPVEGFSKFGTYTGIGTSTTHNYHNFVNCGFKPRFLIIQRTSGNDHSYVYDSARNTANPVDQALQTTVNASETDIGDVYFLSNGFKIGSNSTSDGSNGNFLTYFYMAFAEHPLKNARAF